MKHICLKHQNFRRKGKVKGYADINRFEKRNYTYAMERIA